MYEDSTVSLAGARQYGTDGPSRAHHFLTSGYPSLGTCSVTPQTGRSELTDYSISCQGFSDVDTPLTYSALYTDDMGTGNK